MKKAIMAIAALAATMAALTAHADTWTDPATGITWTYTVSNGKASLGGGSSSSSAVPKTSTGALTIPSKINGYSVTSIGWYAFYNCNGLTSVTIGNGVMSIGWYAFYNCSGLTSVTIPDSVTSIGGFAFYSCSGLTSVTIPDGVTSIGDYAFYDCSGLTSVTIPDSVTSIGNYAFYYCSGLVSFIVGDGNVNYKSVKGLLLSKDGKTLIAGVNGDVMIPDGVTSIGSYVFCNCSGLTSVTIPDSVTGIGDYAFYYCSGLKSVYCLGAPPAGIQGASILFYGMQYYYTREYCAQWRTLIGASRFGGFISAAPANVQIISSVIRENDPTIMDVVYKVTSSKPTVKIRALAFEDGTRSLAKVVRPETFVDGTAPANWDAVEANVEHTLSWKVSSDWATQLAKVKFEILASEGDLLPLELRTIPASDQYGKMKVSWNAISESQVFDALLWLYADKDPGLTLANGALKNGTTQLASGTSTSNPNAIRYIYSKMGYKLLTGTQLNYANSETRLGLSPSGVRQYAYKMVEE